MTLHAIVLTRRHSAALGPATRVCGMPLVGRLLHVLADAGVTQVSVLGDLDREETDAILGDAIEQRLTIDLARRRRDEAETRAIVRISAGSGDAVLVVPGDVVTTERAIVPLLAQPRRDVAIATTRDGAPMGPVLLPRGLFARFQALDEVDDALVALAKKSLVAGLDATGPIRRVVTPRDLAEVELELLASARKPPEADGPIAARLFRPISGVITRALTRTPASPGGVTGASLLLGIVAASLMAFGGYEASVVAAGLYFLSGLLDYVDGELARLTHRAGQGAWFDRVSTDLVTLLMLVGLTAHSYGVTGSLADVVAGVVAMWCLVVSIFAVYVRLLYGRGPGEPWRALFSSPGDRSSDVLAGTGLFALHPFAKRDLLMLAVPLAAVANATALLVWYALVAASLTVIAVGLSAFGNGARARSSGRC